MLAAQTADSVNNAKYIFDDNPSGIKDMTVTTDKKSGCLEYTNADGTHKLSFGFGSNVYQQFPVYDVKCAASAAFRTENCLLIKVQFIDYCVGNMYISLNYLDGYITVMFKKYMENMFDEYNSVFSGRRADMDA